MQEVSTIFQRTLGKVWKMEMLTKLGSVKSITLIIFFLDFEKSKNMEPSEIQFWRAPCFLFFQNLKKNITNLIFLTPEPQEISTV